MAKIDNLLIPKSHGGLKCQVCYFIAAIWMELGRLGAPTYVAPIPGGFNTVLREGTQRNKSTKSWRFVVQANRWNSAITEPGPSSDMAAQTTYTRKMAKVFNLTVANALSPAVLLYSISS